MPVAIPQVVRRAWGEEVVAEFVPWMEERFHEIIREKAVPRDEYREVLSRLDALEKDVALIKGELSLTRAELSQGQAQLRAEFNQGQAQLRAEFREDLSQIRREINERFDRVNEHFDRVNERFDRVNERFDQMGARFDEMYHQMVVQTRWLVGALAVIGTMISVLLAIAQFTP